MANQLYGKARQAFANAEIDWTDDTIKCVLVDAADYTVDIDVDEFLDDIPSGARVGTPQTLGSKANVLGIVDAADVVFPSVTGDPCEGLVIYKDTGVESTSRLIAYIDTATNLPVTPDGNNITVAWDNGSNKIFKL